MSSLKDSRSSRPRPCSCRWTPREIRGLTGHPTCMRTHHPGTRRSCTRDKRWGAADIVGRRVARSDRAELDTRGVGRAALHAIHVRARHVRDPRVETGRAGRIASAARSSSVPFDALDDLCGRRIDGLAERRHDHRGGVRDVCFGSTRVQRRRVSVRELATRESEHRRRKYGRGSERHRSPPRDPLAPPTATQAVAHCSRITATAPPLEPWKARSVARRRRASGSWKVLPRRNHDSLLFRNAPCSIAIGSSCNGVPREPSIPARRLGRGRVIDGLLSGGDVTGRRR